MFAREKQKWKQKAHSPKAPTVLRRNLPAMRRKADRRGDEGRAVPRKARMGLYELPEVHAC